MPIVKMDLMTLVGLADQRDEVVDALMRLGAVELVDGQASQVDTEQTYMVRPADDQQSATAASLARLELAIAFCARLHPVKKKMMSGRRQVDAAAFLGIAAREEELLDQVARLERNRARESDLRLQLGRLSASRAMLWPWRMLDLDLAEQGTEHVQVFLGSIDTPQQKDAMAEQLLAEVPESLVDVLAEDDGGVRCAVATLRTRADLVRSILRRSGFHTLPDLDESGTPAMQLDRIDASQARIEEELAAIEQDHATIALLGPDFEVLHDYLLMRSDRLAAGRNLSASRSTFWLQGWVPAHLTESVRRGLDSQFIVAIDARPAGPQDDYPVLFRNSRLIKPYEVIVEMFSPPSTAEKDPTPLLAPFFFFFFGMMLSDIGYGLILSALCAYLIFKVKARGEMGRMVRMLFLCGISSIIWGVLFGSFFGDMLTVLSGGRIVLPALWFNPMDDATRLMIWSMIFGVVHLFAGMGAKAWLLFMTGRGKDAVMDIFPWYLIIAGLGMTLGGLGGQTGLYLAVAGAAVLLLFGGRGTRNPVMRLMRGLLSLYNITGYLSDILSYTRILALVLATSVIAMVVNLLGFLGGPSLTGFLFYVAVALVGHGLNLALSSLSAYVHTSRLHYVEFFGKFYDGGGRMWKPLKIRTRYIDIVRPPAKA